MPINFDTLRRSLPPEERLTRLDNAIELYLKAGLTDNQIRLSLSRDEHLAGLTEQELDDSVARLIARNRIRLRTP